MKKLLHFPLMMALCFSSLSLVACSDDDDSVEAPEDENDNEVITTVNLIFTAEGADTVTATWEDADGDGGDAPTIDDIKLAANTEYELEVTIQNVQAQPVDEVTEEIQEEAAEHQLFYGGAELQSPSEEEDPNIAAFEYADVAADYVDADELTDEEAMLPVGLLMSVATGDAGSSVLQVVLRHMPPVNDTVVKVDGLAEDYVASSSDELDLPGSNDFDIDFKFEVE